MVGAIILTADNYQQIKILNISRHKKSNFFSPNYLINFIYEFNLIIKNMWSNIYKKYRDYYNFIFKIKYILFYNILFMLNIIIIIRSIWIYLIIFILNIIIMGWLIY